jgi:hypothetical protein
MSTYTVDDTESGLRHLKDLLSVICQINLELAPDETDSRIDSLLWLADDIVKAVYLYHVTPPAEQQEGGEA